jgi:hypothetical protein
VGNLPFRRICKEYGVDITCGEMALSANLLRGQQSEWALTKRHKSEDIFGIQICSSKVEQVTRAAEVLNEEVDVDFIDLNMGCPIDLVFKQVCYLFIHFFFLKKNILSFVDVITYLDIYLGCWFSLNGVKRTNVQNVEGNEDSDRYSYYCKI